MATNRVGAAACCTQQPLTRAQSLHARAQGWPVAINFTAVATNREELACLCTPSAKDTCECVPDAVIAEGGAKVRGSMRCNILLD